MIRILIAKKNSLVGTGIKTTLDREKDLTIVGEVPKLCEAKKLCLNLKPEILILSSNVTKSSLLTETLTDLNQYCSSVKVLLLTNSRKLYSKNLLAIGIAGCVFQDDTPEKLIDAIYTLAQGRTWFDRSLLKNLAHQNSAQNRKSALTRREKEVLNMIGKGWDNCRIADEMQLAQQTVRNYISRIYDKLAIHSRAEAIVWIREHDSDFEVL
jgi:DNA-binding NarL/FixJ family response regulator